MADSGGKIQRGAGGNGTTGLAGTVDDLRLTDPACSDANLFVKEG